MAKDILNLWREEGCQLIVKHFDIFQNLISEARGFAERGQYEMAAVSGEIAACYASGKHCGLFVSLELECLLVSIGRKALGSKVYRNKKDVCYENPKRVLHVATEMRTIGGHSRNLWRWIQQDTERSHSLVLTRQAPIKVPKLLEDAVIERGGRIYVLNNQIGSIISWAKQLREIAASYDLVVLHIHTWDVIPIIAFADRQNSPPILLLDHSDHLFWLGIGVSDVVVSVRESAMYLTRARRKTEAQRNLLLPLILEPTERILSRAEAKRQLDLPEDSVLLLSIARALKYNTIDGINFAEAHVSLLKQYQQAILIVIGPGGSEDWSEAIRQTEGRIRVLSETEHTSVFYQAADIYVDSYPFVSNTSLLEAGSYGVPLVSRYPYSSEANGVLGADMPGLSGNLIRVSNLEEYTRVLSRLVEDEEWRSQLGEATKIKIEATHMGNKWLLSLNQIYSCAATLPKTDEILNQVDEMSLEEPDVFMPYVHHLNIDIDATIKRYLPLMPTSQRFYYWFKLLKKYGWRHSSPTFLLPEWFRLRYYLYLRAVLPF